MKNAIEQAPWTATLGCARNLVRRMASGPAKKTTKSRSTTPRPLKVPQTKNESHCCFSVMQPIFGCIDENYKEGERGAIASLCVY